MMDNVKHSATVTGGKWSRNFFVYATCLVVAALPFGIKWSTYAILVFSLAWLINGYYKNLSHAILSNKLVWLYSGLYLLMIISLVYTEKLADGLWELEKGASLIVFPILFASADRLTLKSIHYIFKTFILSNLMFGIFCLGYAVFRYFRDDLVLFFNFDLVDLFRSHPTYYSMYLIFSGALLIYLHKHDPDTNWLQKKWIVAVLLFYFSFMIILLSVRFIFLIFIILVVSMILRYIIRTRRIKSGLMVLAVFSIFIFLSIRNNEVLRERLLQFMDSYTYKLAETEEGYNGLTTRLAQWESSLPIIKKNLLFGVGPADVQDHLQEAYQKNLLKYSYRDRLNAHNQYIQTCLGLGVIGLLVFCLTLLVPGIIAFRQKSAIHLFFLLLFATCCITESMLYVQKGIVFFSFFNALLTFHLMKPSGTVLGLQVERYGTQRRS